MNSVYVPIVLGTGRDGRESIKVARYVEGLWGSRNGIKTEVIDVLGVLEHPLTIPAWIDDKRVEKWRKIAHKADGYVFVVPEYNHSFPGELKLLLDSAFKEYFGKPVGLVGVSNGKYGGVRVLEHLIPLMANFKTYIAANTVATSNVGTLFDEETGKPDDADYEKFVTAMLDEVEHLAKLLAK